MSAQPRGRMAPVRDRHQGSALSRVTLQMSVLETEGFAELGLLLI